MNTFYLPSLHHLLVSFLASLAVSSSIKTSPIRMGPMQFLVIMRPLLFPSSILHLIWVASPCMPVVPMISIISAGTPVSSTIEDHLLQGLNFLNDLFDQFFAFARFNNSCGSALYA